MRRTVSGGRERPSFRGMFAFSMYVMAPHVPTCRFGTRRCAAPGAALTKRVNFGDWPCQFLSPCALRIVWWPPQFRGLFAQTFIRTAFCQGCPQGVDPPGTEPEGRPRRSHSNGRSQGCMRSLRGRGGACMGPPSRSVTSISGHFQRYRCAFAHVCLCRRG